MSEHGRNLVLAGAILSIMLNPLLFTLLDRYLAKNETMEISDTGRGGRRGKTDPCRLMQPCIIGGIWPGR